MRIFCLLLVSFAPVGLAQEKPSARAVYKVDFVIRDSAGTPPHKVSMLIDGQNGSGNIRTGTRVPIVMEVPDGKGGSGRKTDYVDVGLNLDCKALTIEDRVRLNADIEMSSLRKPETGLPGSISTPAVTSSRTHVSAGLKPGQPTIIAQIDDPVAKRNIEVEVTATPVN